MRLAISLSLLLLFPVLIAFPLQTVQAETTLSAEEKGSGIGNLWLNLEDPKATAVAAPGWRQVQNRTLANTGAWLIGGVLLIIASFYAIRGPVALNSTSDGDTVDRFTPHQRIVHWFVVIQFLLLALTGLVLLYGRGLLEPLFGIDGYAAMASAARAAHNLFGPLFLLGLLLMIPAYLRDNLLRRVDLDWFAAGGGYLHRPASAHRFNAGTKVWFWLVCLGGLGLSVSGLLLQFVSSGVALSHLIHVSLALVMIAVALGHIYLATIGTEGTLRGMVHGKVERRWAAQHHDLWLADLQSADAEAEGKP